MAKYVYEIFLDCTSSLQMNKYRVLYENKDIYVVKCNQYNKIRTLSKTDFFKHSSEVLDHLTIKNRITYNHYKLLSRRAYLDHNPKNDNPLFFKDNSKFLTKSSLILALDTLYNAVHQIKFYKDIINSELHIIECAKNMYPDLYTEEMDNRIKSAIDEVNTYISKEEVPNNESNKDTETNS
jgi:hypothetical protein